MKKEADVSMARAALQDASGVIVLTGAGVSAESGVPTFRDRNGIWAEYDFEELATPEGFARNPRKVWEWYDLRRQTIRKCRPNPGHTSLARLLHDRSDVTLVTQNVDGLHQRALSESVTGDLAEITPSSHGPADRIIELHGNLFRVRCSHCDELRSPVHASDAREADGLPCCSSCGAHLRPDVVWFGEALDSAALNAAFAAAREAELCLVVGTSAVVYPAAGIPLATLDAGGTLIEVNAEVTPLTRLSHISIRGMSGEVLPIMLA